MWGEIRTKMGCRCMCKLKERWLNLELKGNLVGVGGLHGRAIIIIIKVFCSSVSAMWSNKWRLKRGIYEKLKGLGNLNKHMICLRGWPSTSRILIKKDVLQWKNVNNGILLVKSCYNILYFGRQTKRPLMRYFYPIQS